MLFTIIGAEKLVQVRLRCLKCVACHFWRLTENHSLVDALSLTKSPAKQERKISHLRCQDSAQNILSFACLFDEHLPPRVCDWTHKQSRSFGTEVNWRWPVLLALIKFIRGSAGGVRLTAAWDHQSTLQRPSGLPLRNCR